jgi:hypothetical protein
VLAIGDAVRQVSLQQLFLSGDAVVVGPAQQRGDQGENGPCSVRPWRTRSRSAGSRYAPGWRTNRWVGIDNLLLLPPRQLREYEAPSVRMEQARSACPAACTIKPAGPAIGGSCGVGKRLSTAEAPQPAHWRLS